ncbi:MAG TPA: Ig-like domain-containing protein, partial [Actinomycetota bacterium]|nr:Ig-like domain-containing protein [Actinomycetota bacterium]
CLLAALAAAALAAGPAAAQTATTVTGTHVQTLHTSLYGPPSPDPSGIVYESATDRFLISDSEVDEMTIYQGKNLFSGTRTGPGSGTGTTYAFSREPSGIGYNPANRTLFVSDDDRDRIYIDRPGTDGVHGTADDSVTSFSTSLFGSTDPEDVEYDPASGHLFVSDGSGVEIYDVDPVNGVFGDGNDIVTHFDVAKYGSRDAEGLGIDLDRNLLLVVDPSTKSIYELTKAGALVRIIDCRGIPGTNRNLADVTVAPTSSPSDHPSRLNYWIVDRQVDNDTDPTENDGKLYEVSAPSADSPPAVTVTAPSEGATVSGTVAVEASATDDRGVTQVEFSVDGSSIGTDTNGADGWSVPWNTTLVADGTHTVTARASDALGQTGTDSNNVVVDNVATPPTVSVTSPAEGATVSGTVLVQASASDDEGVTEVAFSVDGAAIGTDTDGTNGWSASWDTLTELDGAHVVTATATDTSGSTSTDSNAVNVDNTPPVVAVSSPLSGATVSGTTPVEATASDNTAVASVQFFADGASIGTDTSPTGGWSVSWDTTRVGDGAHTLTATAKDAAGHTTTSAPVVVNVDNPDTAVLDIPVSTGSDDAFEWSDGKISRTGGDLELGFDTPKGMATTTGVRFAGVSVPRGATITRAYVQFQADEKNTTAASLTVHAQSADNAAGFTSTAFSISSRPRTATSATWAPPSWAAGAAGAAQQTSDLSAV